MDSADPFTVPGTLDSLQAIAQYVKTSAKAAGLNRIATHHLRLAVDEIATNIINYGYKDANVDGVLKLYTQIDEHTLTLWIEDNAAFYDPSTVPEPEGLQLPIEDRPIGGLGVYLAIQSVDQFRYERGEAYNRTLFVMKRL